MGLYIVHFLLNGFERRKTLANLLAYIVVMVLKENRNMLHQTCVSMTVNALKEGKQ